MFSKFLIIHRNQSFRCVIDFLLLSGPFVTTASPEQQQGFPMGGIIGISLGTIFLLLLLILLCCYLCRKGKHQLKQLLINTVEPDLKATSL